MASSLRRSTSPRETGAVARNSGASSLEMASQASEAATLEATATSAGAVASASEPFGPIARHSTTEIGMV
ncbi:MAG: hypothetical protein V9G24_01245 [Rhodoblastus sp.]